MCTDEVFYLGFPAILSSVGNSASKWKGEVMKKSGPEKSGKTSPTLRVAATYIGTVVGAGFASGQEVLQFFGLHGPMGILAIAVSSLGFFIFGFASLEVGRAKKATSHGPIMREVLGKTLSPFVDIVTTLFLFGALSTMISGAGSLMKEEFALPWLLGATFMTVLTLVTVLFGLKGVMYAVSSVVPFLLGGVFIVGFVVLYRRGIHLNVPPQGYEPVIRSWLWAAVNYVSYNLIMAVPVLAAMGASLPSSKETLTSSFWGSCGLGAGLLVTYLSIVTSFPESLTVEVPMAKLASDLHYLAKPVFAVIFLAEVYTTAVANLFGFASRITAPGSRKFKWAVILTSAAALVVSSVGFTSLVRIVYPVTGWAGLLFLMGLTVYLFRCFINKGGTGPG